MATHQYRTLTKRIVDRLAVDDKDAVFRDRELPGFGLRVYPSGAKVHVVRTRCAGRSKRAIVGRHGDVSPDQARKLSSIQESVCATVATTKHPALTGALVEVGGDRLRSGC